jgi:hypothetical protein
MKKWITDLSPRSWWLWYAVAAATFLPTLNFYFVGEEAIHPISALEMWYHGEPVKRLLFGSDLQHNPLFAWLITLFSTMLGWELLLPIARGITVSATVLTGLVVAWLAQVLYRDRALSAAAALIYLTLEDVFFYRGWLAYTDPLSSLFMFSAIACLWVACERRSYRLLALALIAVFAAFMSGRVTAYVFYAGAGFVLVFRPDFRQFLLCARSITLHAAGLALPFLWFALFASSSRQGVRMFSEVLDKLIPSTLGEYLLKLSVYTVDVMFSLVPLGLLALWLVIRRRREILSVPDYALIAASWIAFLNFLPYWLAPQSHIRYLLPLYPLAGLIIARVLWLAGSTWMVRARWCILVLIMIKLILVLVLFPLYQQRYRGANYAEAAREIIQKTAGHVLYTTDVSASGLSVAAYINLARLSQPPLTLPPTNWNNGFVIAYVADPGLGAVVEKYRLGGNDLYLLCRGTACATR